MSVVIKISKPTFDVRTTGNQNLTFSSELATHSIFNVVEATKTNGNTSVTINHGLGFVPKVWVFVEDSDGDGDFLTRVPVDRFVDFESIDYYINNDDIVIQTDSSSIVYDFKVIIFTRSPKP